MVLIHGIEYVPKITIGAPRQFESLGDALRAMRKEALWTLAQAAREIGITKSYMWALEKGISEPSLRLAKRIAGAYGVPISVLSDCMPERGDANGL